MGVKFQRRKRFGIKESGGAFTVPFTVTLVRVGLWLKVLGKLYIKEVG